MHTNSISSCSRAPALSAAGPARWARPLGVRMKAGHGTPCPYSMMSLAGRARHGDLPTRGREHAGGINLFTFQSARILSPGMKGTNEMATP